MKINDIGNTTFKANYYTVNKRGNYFNIRKISTDNEENLGKEPVLQTKYLGDDIELPMIYDGKYYTAEFKYDINKYRIYYKDTGKYERGGKEQVIENPLYYTKTATKEDKKYNDLPPEQAFAKGKAEGKVFVNTSDIPKNIPAILVADEIKDEEALVLDIPHNVKGVITSSCNFGVLSHCANLTRNRISAISIIWDENKFNNLKEQEGKYIRINNEDGILKYDNVKPNEPTKQFVPQKPIQPPKLENVERLLDFDELTPQNCGNKGYRLKIMKDLTENGELKNINLPNGFVIPEGYINNYKKYIDVEDKEEWKNRIINGIYTQDTENKIKELGLPRRYLIIRSNYNTEDLGCFSSAGIYDSKQAGTLGSIIDEAVFDVIYTTEISKLAKTVHEKYGIKDKDIQPSVIIQEYIPANYNFTVYSDDGNNNVLIEMSDSKLGYLTTNPALIMYNKKTKELTVTKKQSPLAEYMFDENGKLIDQKHPQDKITENWEDLKPLLNIVTEGAQVLENYFNHPQDIEGGITKDGKVYFWQTRDIVSQGKI